MTIRLRPWCRYLLALLLSFGLVSSLVAGPQPNWDKATALQAANLEQSRQQVGLWQQQIDAGQAEAVLAELQQAAGTGTPAFEARLYGLAQSMAEAPLDAGSEHLLAWLENYRPEVLVAHEESPSYGVALFPVAAAASGSRIERQRRAAQLQTDSLVDDPPRWLAAYLAASPAAQQGMEQGLRMNSSEALAPLAAILPAELALHPSLATVAGIVANSRLDVELLLAAYRHAEGASTVQLLRDAGWQLDASQRSRLLQDILDLPGAVEATDRSEGENTRQDLPSDDRMPAAKTALGISLLAPGLSHNAEISNRLLQLLDDQQLGAAAALALAGHPDSKVQASLRQKLDAGGLAGQRAALALDQPVSDTLQRTSEGEQQ